MTTAETVKLTRQALRARAAEYDDAACEVCGTTLKRDHLNTQLYDDGAQETFRELLYSVSLCPRHLAARIDSLAHRNLALLEDRLAQGTMIKNLQEWNAKLCRKIAQLEKQAV